MESNQDLKRRVAYLESRLDQIESELTYVNQLLLACGFPEGVESLKYTIEDLLEEEATDEPSSGPRPQTFDFLN